MNDLSPIAADQAAPLSPVPHPDAPSAIIVAAQRLLPHLERGQRVDAAILRAAMKAAFGASDASGAWDWKTAYDACEAATVLFLRKYGKALFRKADCHARRLDKIRDGVKPGEIGERAGKIRSAVLRMTHLMDNLLNSSRLIDGGAGLYLHPGEMDLTALLQEVCQLHREMVPGSQITERFTATPVPMVGDAKLLFQVFSNLLSNAIKYSPGGGMIAVEAWSSADADAVAVAVADRGIGIPPSDLDRLFERYHRGSNVSGIVGTGVGLYLVKMAVELHHGRVEVDSEEGKGSRFTVRLPRRPATTVKDRSANDAAAMTEA